ncbi:hypothetical protein TNCT_592961 [Trichonephila clavata]|uniref:Uncharacterized protein n=1 Tax=Trichonephila clavata TaxID=2740835 RepID=A0A8X6HV05_TRICU|nr:hypothetical protein TNCT_592961 [Trichonephila clavata]
MFVFTFILQKQHEDDVTSFIIKIQTRVASINMPHLRENSVSKPKLHDASTGRDPKQSTGNKSLILYQPGYHQSTLVARYLIHRS